MHTRKANVILLGILATASCLAAPFQQQIRETATALPWLDMGGVLWEREMPAAPDSPTVVGLLRHLPTSYTREDVLPLLKDPDSKVRTLGIVMLYRLHRLDVLPDIASLADDTGPAFPQPEFPEVANQPVSMAPETVSNYARFIIEFYAGQDLWQLPDAKKGIVEQMRAYSAARPGPLSSALLIADMKRATGEITPIQPERVPRIREVAEDLQQVPMPRRFFLALRLNTDDCLASAGFPESYGLDLARQVPREIRLAALKGTLDIGDPDIRGFDGYGFILAHAADLLRSSDAPLLLQLEAESRKATRTVREPNGLGSPDFVTAAAALDAPHAEEILTAALARFSGEFDRTQRAPIAIALAKLGSDTSLATALNWFFNDVPMPGTFGGGREAFLNAIHYYDASLCRKVVARIIRDRRFTNLGTASTAILLNDVQGYLGWQLASQDKIRDLARISEAGNGSTSHVLGSYQKLLRDTVNEWDISPNPPSQK